MTGMAELILEHRVTRTGRCMCGSIIHEPSPENMATHLAQALTEDGYGPLLPFDGLSANPTNSGGGNEQDRSNDSQPQQPLHSHTNHSQNQPNRKQNNHQGSHAPSLRPTPDEWNGTGIAPEAIEAAAITIYVGTAADDSGPFEAFTQRKKDHYRAKAKHVLEAAYPFIAAQAKAEALGKLADDFDELASKASYSASEDVMETWLEAATRARAATIEGKSE